jgi:hypothetical protein
MVPHPGNSGTYRVTLNNHDDFLPPGLMFGLMYTCYLNNTYGYIMENEMSVLHWPPQTLMPYQVEEHMRKKT